jgi:hypothetical protein
MVNLPAIDGRITNISILICNLVIENINTVLYYKTVEIKLVNATSWLPHCEGYDLNFKYTVKFLIQWNPLHHIVYAKSPMSCLPLFIFRTLEYVMIVCDLGQLI